MKRLATLILIASTIATAACGDDLSKTSKKSAAHVDSPADSPAINNQVNNTNIIATNNAIKTGNCGDNIVDEGEACDGVVEKTCADLGFDDGEVTCSVSCTVNSNGCVRYSCGDGILQGEESCDDGELNGEAGKCNSNCSGATEFCGDVIINANEACDGANLGGQTCQSRGFQRGELRCGECGLDTSGCSTCGDGIVGEDELCDDGASNGTYGHCNATCDAQGEFCGDGIKQAQEQCDGNVAAGTSCTSLGRGRGTVTCNSNCTMAAMCTMMPTTGELAFTEIMADPTISTDSDGEWFEMRNLTARVIDLSGCMIESSTSTGMESFTITSLSVAPGAYVTFARNSNAPFVADYTYNAGINLNNTTDSLALYCDDGMATHLVDYVGYDNGATFPDPTGASISLNPARVSATQNDLGSNWCAASSSFGVGDLGTPGAANDACF
jgi:hypothetical protein